MKISKFSVRCVSGGYILTTTESCDSLGEIQDSEDRGERVFVSLDAMLSFLKQEVFIHGTQN